MADEPALIGCYQYQFSRPSPNEPCQGRPVKVRIIDIERYSDDRALDVDDLSHE
jgi:hypothetical protein